MDRKSAPSPRNPYPDPRCDGPMKVSELMGRDPVIELEHEGQIYRLRITRNRKLILTK